jgi:hypothetical protein
VGLALNILISIFVEIVLRWDLSRFDIVGLRQQFSTRLGCIKEEAHHGPRGQKLTGDIKEV